MIKRKLFCACCQNLTPISGGLFLRGRYFCARCESEIAAGDLPESKYEEVVDLIKSIFFKKASGCIDS